MCIFILTILHLLESELMLFHCRNYGLGDTSYEMDMRTLKHQKSEFIMRVGKHEAKVSS